MDNAIYLFEMDRSVKVHIIEVRDCAVALLLTHQVFRISHMLDYSSLFDSFSKK